MTRPLHALVALAALLLVSCGSPNPAQDDGRIPEDLSIGLERTQCYGSCPAYTVSVRADGGVTFVGKHFTATDGQAEGQIGEDKLRELIQAFGEAHFFGLEDAYTMDRLSNCATDNPTVTTTFTINGKSKGIQDYQGCAAPRELSILEDRIDEIVGTQKWIGKRN